MQSSIKFSVCLAAAAGALGSAAQTEAQSPRHTDLGAGVYGGGVVPLNGLRDSAKIGYHIGGMIDRQVLNSLAIRVDVAFNKFSDKTLTEAPTFREVGTNLLFGTVSAEVFPRGGAARNNLSRAVSHYLLAGYGVYSFRFDHVCRGPACIGPERVETVATRAGVNVGAGSVVSVRRWKTFLQVGYHITLPGSRANGRLLLVAFGLRSR